MKPGCTIVLRACLLAGWMGVYSLATVAAEAPTFSKEVAPVIFGNCAKCHRAGQSGPFPLLTYADAKKHGKEIASTTARRYMPPWLPEKGFGEFMEERRLTEAQIDLIQKWFAAGMPEGDPKELPALPTFAEGWMLGKPDLVVQMPFSYSLAADGKDVYRNFVFPIPNDTGRHYIRGVEFNPGNSKVVHHAFVNVDVTRQSRRQAEKENPPGFNGMRLPDSAIMPGGHFLGWQPGKVPYFGRDGIAWGLETNSDVVLQLHMHPSGRIETVQPTIAFYYTDQAPTNTAYRINLNHLKIDIAAGHTNFVIEDSYTLPIDVNALAVSPHAHYLAREMHGFAILPDGTKKWLLKINDWDFNWQGDYRYKEPVFLPRGSKICMRFSYDNSTNNIRNPFNPPRRVKYGLETTDEMGELWFSVLPVVPTQRNILAADFYKKLAGVTIDYNTWFLESHPNDAAALTKIARAKYFFGDAATAMKLLHEAVSADPTFDKAHYELGFIHFAQGRFYEAKEEFETVIRLNPSDFQAHGYLGSIYLRLGDLNMAETSFAKALKANPDDKIAARNLEMVRKRKAGQPAR